jgi:hypothetical protein
MPENVPSSKKRLLPDEFLAVLNPCDWIELDDSFDAFTNHDGLGPGPGGFGNRAFALRHALALGGKRVPPVAELPRRAPLKAVAEWMVRWKYLRHDDLPAGWVAANVGTKAHKNLRSAVDAGIAAQESRDEQRGSTAAAVA